MSPKQSSSDSEIDALLASLPEKLKKIFGPYQQKPGYLCWKAGRWNWLQWNDRGESKRKRFENAKGAVRTWEIFARFGRSPGAPWEPARYEAWRWMLGGADVWGCSRESLRAYEGSIAELERRLIADLKIARDHSSGQSG